MCVCTSYTWAHLQWCDVEDRGQLLCSFSPSPFTWSQRRNLGFPSFYGKLLYSLRHLTTPKYVTFPFFWKIYVLLLCVYACLPLCSTAWMQCPGGQKRAQEHLEPELQTTVNCYVSAGNRTWLYLASTRGVRAAKPSLQPQATFLSYLFFSETNLKKCLPTSFTFFLRLDQLSSLLVHFNYGLTYYGFQHLQFDSEPKGNKHQEKKSYRILLR